MSRLEFIVKYVRGKSVTWHFILALALTAVIGFIDYRTGNEVTVDPFYSIPILLMVWFGNKNLAIVMSIFCAFAWWWANAAGSHPYSSEWLRIWDTIVRLMFFCLVMFAGAIFKQQRDSIRDRVELLERSQQLELEIINISEREQQRIGRDLRWRFVVAGERRWDWIRPNLFRKKRDGIKYNALSSPNACRDIGDSIELARWNDGDLHETPCRVTIARMHPSSGLRKRGSS